MRILIADDERNNRTILQKMVESILPPVVTCDLVMDGLEAVEAFMLALEEKQPYDLILLDIMMPEMNGQDALKSIRAFEKEQGVAGMQEAVIFMVTALDTEKQVVEAFFRGCCTDYLTKPVTWNVLREKLKEYNLLDS